MEKKHKGHPYGCPLNSLRKAILPNSYFVKRMTLLLFLSHLVYNV